MGCIRRSHSKTFGGKKLVDEQLGGKATSSNFDAADPHINYTKYSISKSKLRNTIIDCSVLEKFDIPNAASDINKEQIIVTFFKQKLRCQNF